MTGSPTMTSSSTQVRVRSVSSGVGALPIDPGVPAPGKSDGRGRRTRHGHHSSVDRRCGLREYLLRTTRPEPVCSSLKRWNSQSRQYLRELDSSPRPTYQHRRDWCDSVNLPRPRRTQPTSTALFEKPTHSNCHSCRRTAVRHRLGGRCARSHHPSRPRVRSARRSSRVAASCRIVSPLR